MCMSAFYQFLKTKIWVQSAVINNILSLTKMTFKRKIIWRRKIFNYYFFFTKCIIKNRKNKLWKDSYGLWIIKTLVYKRKLFWKVFNNRYNPLNKEHLNSRCLNRQCLNRWWIKFKISQNYQDQPIYKRNSEEVIYCDIFQKHPFQKSTPLKNIPLKKNTFKKENTFNINRIQNVFQYTFEYLLLNLIVRCFCVSFLKIYFKDNFLYELLKTFNMDQGMIF